MAGREPLITMGDLKSTIYSGSFKNIPHKFYVVYDDIMDELIVKVTKPDTLVAEFPVSDSVSLLVEPQTLEVVGLQYSEFTKEHLPNMHDLNRVWGVNHLAEFYATYQEINYTPHEPATQPKSEYFFVRPETLERDLARA